MKDLKKQIEKADLLLSKVIQDCPELGSNQVIASWFSKGWDSPNWIFSWLTVHERVTFNILHEVVTPRLFVKRLIEAVHFMKLDLQLCEDELHKYLDKLEKEDV
jgi:hypothetical protein